MHCQSCSKKLSLVLQQKKCKCGYSFCNLHFSNHECKFDYKKQHKENLRKYMKHVQSSTLMKI